MVNSFNALLDITVITKILLKPIKIQQENMLKAYAKKMFIYSTTMH